MVNNLEKNLFLIRNMFTAIFEVIPELFLSAVNLSITACWLILVVLILRKIMRKAPKWIHCSLWGLVGLRLIFPFSIESIFSLVPSAETIDPEIIHSNKFEVNTGFEGVDSRVNDYLGDNYYEGVTVPSDFKFDVTSMLAVIWLIGMALMLGYAVYSYMKLKRDMKMATPLGNNIRQSEKVGSPFVLGMFKPTIYLPYHMNLEDIQYVIAHENAHIKRKDHWIKPFGYLILSVYWFNPLLWVAYILLCKDIELACDEKVIRSLGAEQRQDYSLALLNCSIKRYRIAACPLAFGEVSVKERVKSVMNYKKPAFWIIVAGVIACVIVAVCFLTNPKDKLMNAPEPFGASYRVIDDVYYDPLISSRYIVGETTPYYSFSNDYALFESKKDALNWEQVQGKFEKIKLKKDNFDVYFNMMGDMDTLWMEDLAEKLRKENKNTWRFDIQKDADAEKNIDNFYYFMQQKNGDVYLAVGHSETEEYICEGTVERVWFYCIFKLEVLDRVYVDVVTEGMTAMMHPGWWPSGTFNEEQDQATTVSINDSCKIEVLSDMLSAVEKKEEEKSDTETEKILTLDEAISESIIDQNADHYPTGNLACENHIILKTDQKSFTPKEGVENRFEEVIVYAMAYYQVFGSYGSELTNEGSSHLPVIMTFEIEENGNHKLTDYWQPTTAGADYVKEVKAAFPDDIEADALDTQKFIKEQQEACERKAMEHMEEYGSVDQQIVALLEKMCNTQLSTSSAPADYIEWFSEEYEQLLAYDEYTLRYCFEQFLKGGQTDLRGAIMAQACREIMMKKGEAFLIEYEVATGQEWFEAFKKNVGTLERQYKEEEVEKYYPGSWMLKQLLNGTDTSNS